MKKVDLVNLEVFTDMAHTMCTRVNVKDQVANELYTHGSGLACHALALKIYNSSGQVELSDEEYALLMQFADAMFTPNMIDALRNLKTQDDGNGVGK